MSPANIRGMLLSTLVHHTQARTGYLESGLGTARLDALMSQKYL